MTDTVMGFSRCNRHGLLASVLVLSVQIGRARIIVDD